MSMKTKPRRRRPTPSLATEYRSSAVPLEVRSAGGDAVTVAGWASTTSTPYTVGSFTETIRRGAFETTLASRPDVVLLLNHAGLPLARTVAGNLDLDEDRRGLHFRARLDPADADTQAVARKLKSGLLTECSFAFRVVADDWNEACDQREIREVDLNRGDVSLVTFGANATTSAELLSARMARSVAMAHRRRQPIDLEFARAWAYASRLRQKGRR